MAHDEQDESEGLTLVVGEDQIDLATFVTKARAAIDDMADSFEADEGRTEDEWMEELTKVVHES